MTVMQGLKRHFEPVAFWGLVSGLFLFLFILFFLDLSPGHPEVTRTFAVAVLMAVWWITEAVPLAVTALLPVFLFPALGIMNGTTVSSTYFNHIIFLFLGGFIVALAMEKWNLHKRIALKIMLTIGVSPGKLLLGFMVATAFLSMWISNTATAMMMIPIALSVIKELDQACGKDDHYATGLFLSVAYSASIGGMSTLVGTPPNLVFVRILSILFPEAPEISFSQWMAMGIPITLFMLIAAWLLLYLMYKPTSSWENLSVDVIRDQYRQLDKLTYEQKVVGLVFLILAILWITRSGLSFERFTIPGWSQLFRHPEYINDGTVAMAAAVILFLIPSRNHGRERIMDWKTANRLPWNMILLFGGGFALAKGFEVSGLSVWIGEQLKWVGDYRMIWIILIITTMMSLLTELTSNVASTQMLLPVFAGLAVSIGVNPLMVMIPVTLAASLAFMLPTATPPNAIVFGTERIPIRTMIRTGFLLNMTGVLLIYLFVHLIGPGILHAHSLQLPGWAVIK